MGKGNRRSDAHPAIKPVAKDVLRVFFGNAVTPILGADHFGRGAAARSIKQLWPVAVTLLEAISYHAMMSQKQLNNFAAGIKYSNLCISHNRSPG